MSACCAKAAEALARKQGRVLRIVLGLNLAMFFVEAASGLLGRSSALLGDSLDMLGDALAYGATLYALNRAAAWKARAAVLKGGLMALTAMSVLIAAIARAASGALPSAGTMGVVAVAALAVNALCLGLLMRHRADDVNMSSAWTCSRNDLIANGLVIVAGGMVALTRSLWPDFIVGVGIAVLFMSSAVSVLRAARKTTGLPATGVRT